jgi:hypothetical protein
MSLRHLLPLLVLALMTLAAPPLGAEEAAPAAPAGPAPSGHVTAANGPVRVLHTGKVEFETLAEKDPLFEGDRVKTLGGGRVRILLVDDSLITLGENSELKILKVEVTGQKRKTLIGVIAGKVRAVVSKFFKDVDSSFQVEGTTAVAGVRGTDFVVIAPDQDHTEVVVLEGEVEVRSLFDKVVGKVAIKTGEATTVVGEAGPTPAVKQTDERLRQLKQDLDVPVKKASLDTLKSAQGELPPVELEPVYEAGATVPDVLPEPERGEAVNGQAGPSPTPLEPETAPGAEGGGGTTDVDVKPQLPPR